MPGNRKGMPQKRNANYERQKAKAHGAKRIGGPSNPGAITKSGGKMEMKDLSTPVPKPEVVKAHRKGVTRFIAKKGFTQPAIEYGQKHSMKLYKGKNKLT